VKETLETINQMQADGVIGKYAIGGAVGATFYIEPAATVDLDVFVMLPAAASHTLISLSPIYEYLKAKGGREESEYIVLGDWPVQFLVPSDALEIEAIAQAVPIEVDGARTWVMSPEHLAAIALRTDRPKDHIRIIQFISQGALDRDKLNTLLLRYGLIEKWKHFENRFLEGTRG
jgi:hypothetical protein